MTALASHRKHAHSILKGISRDQREIRFVATRFEVDRDKEVIVPSGMNTAPFEKNPTLLLQHDPLSPIGRVISLQFGLVDGVPGWVGIARLDPPGTSDAADRAYRQINSGSLNGISIGFMVDESSPRAVLPGQRGLTFSKTTLLEISLVTIPSCANCVILEKTLGKETTMDKCNCEEVEIDLAAINRSIKASDSVGLSNLERDEIEIDPQLLVIAITETASEIISEIRAGIKTQARLAATEAVNHLTGRLP